MPSSVACSKTRSNNSSRRQLCPRPSNSLNANRCLPTCYVPGVFTVERHVRGKCACAKMSLVQSVCMNGHDPMPSSRTCSRACPCTGPAGLRNCCRIAGRPSTADKYLGCWQRSSSWLKKYRQGTLLLSAGVPAPAFIPIVIWPPRGLYWTVMANLRQVSTSRRRL